MAVRLTETAITSNAKRAAETGQRIDLADAAQPGLRLRLTPAGSRTWVLACRDNLARMRRFPLGRHPDLGISEARQAARAMRAEVTKGADPVADRRRQRAIGRDARAGIGTLTALLDLYATKEGYKLRSWPEQRRRIDHVFRRHLCKPVENLTARDLQLTADAHPSQQSAAAATRYLRPVLKWAAIPARGYIPAATAALSPPATVAERERVLSVDELRALLPVLAESSRPYAAACRFMLLTLARREEVARAQWRHLDLAAGTWLIPNTKNGQPHTVPLSRQAIELLRARLPASAQPDGFIFATAQGGRLINWDRETKVLQTKSGVVGWQRHDLRRTGATLLGEMGELPDIVEATLNHVAIKSRLARIYNRSRYRPHVAVALQRLADRLDGIAAAGADVVPLRA